MTFRDKTHTSLMTGSKAPPHHTPWLTAFDDTAESYVAKNKEAALKLNSPRVYAVGVCVATWNKYWFARRECVGQVCGLVVT